eukprot:jgi/Psemu1/209789/e_gw1.512.63.1
MDFDNAAARLARDHSKMRGRNKGRGKGGGIAISAKAAKQAEYQKKQQARLRAEREKKKKDEAYRTQYLHDCRRQFRERSLLGGSSSSATSTSATSTSTSLLLTPTSIHGNGDKIALPPSVLETLTSQSTESSSNPEGGNPWTFRIGVPNPDYRFPASPLFRDMVAPTENDDDDNDDDDMSDDDETDEKYRVYLDELNHKYLAYTHCTVVEFTQDEGHVGIPRHIAEALLDPNNQHGAAEIPTTTTVDPALSADGEAADDNDDVTMQIDDDDDDDDDGSKQTPGHLAWGAFAIPDVRLEITMVQLPKGRECTLVPTEEAIRNNFYGLKDVKLVLEQSLIRTRATLSKGDKVSTWHRGKKFLLTVAKVVPSSFEGVTCINTDIEVEIGEATATTTTETTAAATTTTTTTTTPSDTSNDTSGFRLGTGRSMVAAQPAVTHDQQMDSSQQEPPVSLRAEPPAEQKQGVCTVQIRFSGGHGKRRFAIETDTVKDLFAFAVSLVKRNEQTFRLVTRFPRREFGLVGSAAEVSNGQLRGETTLEQAGIQQGQEMFMVEDL